MTPRRRVLMTALKLYDVGLAAACFAAAAVASERKGVSVEAFLATRISVGNVLLLAALLVVWHLILVVLGVYDGSKRLMTAWREVAGVLWATAAGAAALYLLAVAFRITMVTGLFLPAFFASVSVAMVASRLLLRSILRAARRRGRNLRYVLIVGTNRRAVACARKLQATPELGYRLVGFVDASPSHGGADLDRWGHRFLGDLDVVPDLLRREVVDEVMVFLPLKSFYEQGWLVVQQCEEQGVRVTLPSSAFECKKARVVPEGWGDDPVVTLAPGAIVGAPAAVKRAIDVVVAALLLVLLAPLLVVVAVAIKVTSPGPVLFSQERVGLNKRRFRMLKFRTMVVDAEQRLAALQHLNEASGPVFKIRKDPRLTPIGALLRTTSIDELPQLLNVLKGDLSLVGPRPLPLRDYEGFSLDWHRRRFSVRPGITCLWQIGGRSNVSFERWMELDMEYIDTWSLWLDCKILLKTIPAVLRGTGAA